MKIGALDVAYFRIDGIDLLPAKLQALGFRVGVKLEKTDGIGDPWALHHPTGRRTLVVTQAGAYFTADVDGIHGLMIGWPPGPHLLELAFAGGAEGDQLLTADGTFIASYEVLARQGQLTRANATYTVSGAVTFGTVPPPP